MEPMYFNLHGIYNEHFGSNPQDVLPNLTLDTPVELRTEYNEYDKYAVAAYASGKFIGWIPKGENKKIYNLLNNNTSLSCSISRLYTLDDGIGAEIVVNTLNRQSSVPQNTNYQYSSYSDNMYNEGISPKSKAVDLLLCIFLGWLGIHKFYERKIGMGILYWFTGGLFFIGWWIDIFTIASGKATDFWGRKIIN